MTVASKLKQTLASLKGASATMERFATHHPDEQTKQVFMESQQLTDQMIQDLERRIREVEFEEPQFKGY